VQVNACCFGFLWLLRCCSFLHLGKGRTMSVSGGKKDKRNTARLNDKVTSFN
jgi:hypothetical protein